MTRLHQTGFTLIELMVAITLGLLITAAAIQLYLTSVTSFNVQKAMSNIQDSASFGVNYILDDVRKANLSASSAYINDQQANAGLLLTQDNVGIKQSNGQNILEDNDLTRSGGGFSNVNSSNLEGSDQLTIRYSPNQIGYDCTGGEIALSDLKLLKGNTILGDRNLQIIQRYKVHINGALTCRAMRYYPDEDFNSKGLLIVGKKVPTWNLNGEQIIIPSVDYMRIKVGYVKGALNNPTALNYVSVADYLDTAKTPAMTKNIDGISQQIKPYINVIQIGLLVQSNETAGNDVNVRNRNKKTFDVLGQSVALNSTNQDTRLRQVVTQTISLRNAMGWVEEGYVTQ